MEINNFRGELTDISAKKEALLYTWYWLLEDIQIPSPIRVKESDVLMWKVCVTLLAHCLMHPDLLVNCFGHATSS